MYTPLKIFCFLVFIITSPSVKASQIVTVFPSTPQVVGVAPPHDGDFTDIVEGNVDDNSFRLDLYCNQYFPGSFSCSEQNGFGDDLDSKSPMWYEESRTFSSREDYGADLGDSGHWYPRNRGPTCESESEGPWSSSSYSQSGSIRIPGLNWAVNGISSCSESKSVACCELRALPEPGKAVMVFCGVIFLLFLKKCSKSLLNQ